MSAVPTHGNGRRDIVSNGLLEPRTRQLLIDIRAYVTEFQVRCAAVFFDWYNWVERPGMLLIPLAAFVLSLPTRLLFALSYYLSLWFRDFITASACSRRRFRVSSLSALPWLL